MQLRQRGPGYIGPVPLLGRKFPLVRQFLDDRQRLG